MGNLCLCYDHKPGYLDNPSQSHNLLVQQYKDQYLYSKPNLSRCRKRGVVVQQCSNQKNQEHLMDNLCLYYDHKSNYLDNPSLNHNPLVQWYMDQHLYSKSNQSRCRKRVVQVQQCSNRKNQEHLMDNPCLCYDHRSGYLGNLSQSHNLLVQQYKDQSLNNNSNQSKYHKMQQDLQ